MLNVKKITLRKYNNYMLEIFKYLTYKNYIKNIIIFFPIIFEDINSVSITSLSVYLLFFISMCLTAQAVYILNDFKDQNSDKIVGKSNIFNDIKKNNKNLSNKDLFLFFFLINFINIFLLFYLFQLFQNGVKLVLLYYLINIIYNYFSKKIKYLDVLSIASLYALRVMIGITILTENNYYIKNVLFIFFGSLFLLSSKRYLYTNIISKKKGSEYYVYRRTEIKNFLIANTYLLNLFCVYFFFGNTELDNKNLIFNTIFEILIIYISFNYLNLTLKGILDIDIIKNLLKKKFFTPILIFITLYLISKVKFLI